MVREGPDPLNDYLRICEALDEAVQRLDPVSSSARLDAELLLARALDVQRSYLFAHPEDSMDTDAAQRFETAIAQRIDGMPMAYITGEKEFWSMPLIVSPATLVPRPETETLVEQALLLIPRKAEWAIADLGTGSGAIALAIARERPLCHVWGTDISEDALAVAAENARQLSLPNVDFLAGNWTEPVADRQFDIVISNPPYRRVNSGRINPNHQRAVARHELKINLEELVATACRLLPETGKFVVMYTAERITELLHQMHCSGLEPKRLRMIHSTVDSDAKLMMVEGVKGGRPGIKISPPLLIYTRAGIYTREIEEMMVP